MKLFVILIILSFQVFAEDFPGGNVTTSEEEFSKGFGEDQGMQKHDEAAVTADRLKMGGLLQYEYQIHDLENTPIEDYTTNPMMLELYLDSQLKDDLRVFFRGRFTHDAAIDPTVPNIFTGQLMSQDSSALDEMKIMFNTKKKIFWTLGVQKVKWGAAKFWNPTDFLNLQRRDFLRQEDLRAGISMVKAHVPFGDNNFYLFAVHERSLEAQQTGTAARFEIPFSAGEFTLSGYARKGLPANIGADISFALGDFDIYAEAADNDKNTNKKVSGGLSYEFKYSDEDLVSLGVEGFWQDEGADDIATYPALVTARAFVPFYVAKSYGLFSIFLPKPSSWNQSSFIFYALQNTVDFSQYYRLAYSYTGMSDAIWTLAVGARIGEAGTEAKLFGETQDVMLQLKVAF